MCGRNGHLAKRNFGEVKMSPRPQSATQLQRMLALVPWILANPETTIDELAKRFEVSSREIEKDLAVLPLCGLPPYTADRLIDVLVSEDGSVSIRLAEYFERPLRLTPGEGLALLAAGRALLAVPGSDPSGPLANALVKLEEVVGGPVAVDVGNTDNLSELQSAVAKSEQVEMVYHSFARDEISTRRVDPQQVFHALGFWYLAAFCHQADDNRLFRIDRVQSVRLTGEQSKKRPVDDDFESIFHPKVNDERVRLLLNSEALWVIEDLPIEDSIERDDGKVEVVIAVSGTAFLDRLLLRLGPAVEVIDPPSARDDLVKATQRILDLYSS